MSDPRARTIAAFFERSRQVFDRAAQDAAMLSAITRSAGLIAAAFRRGDKLLIAGNGGSAADAQHIAAEFLSRFKFDRAPLPAIALTTDSSNLTAIGNDYGFERVFERQVRGLGRKGDVFIGITTSGRSPNILAALKAARETGLTAIGFTGMPGAGMSALCDLTLVAPSEETALIQQIHITAAHAICEAVERELFAGG
ncbi:MAG TPA: D-sedoheptulose 7-phosphate isomerase [Pseudorhodoplanes sp.]|jgi:D-sedoheptulose 7-phosphate isomerase|nr:D-sedoheptulose 7-phosphate isomerase [Pseudorhodoplanes sp.]